MFYDPTTSTIDTSNITIKTNVDNKTMNKNDEFKITVSLNNAGNLNNKLLRFTSSDESVATVRQNGIVTAKKGGSATITIYSEQEPTIKKTVTITVNKTPGEIEEDPNHPVPPDGPDDPDNPVNPGLIITGDLNRDGKVNAEDAAIAIELFKTQDATFEDLMIGDMNEDDTINAEDAALIIEYFKTH